ncbi:MAG TPA: ABC transporter ATP-binding protein [Candidatus Thermoplasmatota archaeon]|nr:ABC transporter ATP-binding protein [Candidatus Thermoplasmatota archaeon]
MAGAVLSMRSLTKSYGALSVLREASFDARAGEVCVLRGASGSGKSTMLHLCGLMDTAEAGVVLHQGKDLSGASEAERAAERLRGIGFVFQRCYLVPTLTAAANVALPMKAAGLAHAEREERVRQLLEEVGLHGREEHYPHELSGGQQQMVAVARALANAPYLLLADEPTAELDPAHSARVMDMLSRAARGHGAAVVIVTHQPASAPAGAVHYELRDGRPQEVA